MSEASKAVFLSYASQDAAAAKRICEALRAAGVEVWFDQSELVGGDAWDAKIRKQIKDCALFVPMISASTQARDEGYFRLEWKLAAQRTHMMTEEKTFLLPVVIDGTRDGEAKVPAEFRGVQWTRLPGGEAPAAFCSRVGELLGGNPVAATSRRAEPAIGRPGPYPSRRFPRMAWIGVTLAVLGLLGAGGYRGYRWYYQRQERAVLEALNLAPEPPIERDGRVLVAPPENRTGEPALDDLGRQLAEHLRRRLPELEWVAQAKALRPAERITEEASAADMRALARQADADTLVTGFYRRAGDRLTFHGQVFDLRREMLFAELAPVEGDLAAPQAAIVETAERLLGALVPVPRVRQGRRDASKFFDFAVPRRFDSTQIADQGKADDLGRYRRAYERDPKGGVGSLIALAMSHLGRKQYAEADAVLREVEAQGLARLPEYPREIGRWLRALLDGDVAAMEVSIENLCRLAPPNRVWRLERGIGFYRSNRPRALLAEFKGITPGSPGERVSSIWRARVVAYFLLDDAANLEVAARRLQELDSESETACWALSYLALRRGDFPAAMRVLDRYDGLRRRGGLDFNLHVASLAAMRVDGRAGTPEFATLVRRAESWLDARPAAEAKEFETRIIRAEVTYLAGRYEEALRLGQEMLRERPDDVRVIGFVGTAAARVGQRPLAEETIARLRALDPRFRFGYPRFAEAKIAAVLGRNTEALQLLREAFARYTVAIKDFSWEGLRLSPDFESLRGDPGFQEFIKARD